MEIHVVRQGETLYQISRRYGVSVQQIVSENQLQGREQLVTGQTIVILYPGDLTTSPKPFGEIYTNGYAYTFIDRQILRQALPYLTALTIFGYGFTMDGELLPLDDEELIYLANEYNAKPVMLISSLTEGGSFSSERASYLFQNPDIQEVLLDNILDVMNQKGYKGLDIDFEYVNPEDREGFITFIRKATEKLHPYGYTVHVDLAPKTSDDQRGLLYESHDYAAIGAIADTVLLMTYEWGYTYGPPMAVAPLNQVRRVLEYGLSRINANKILMGIPNYGYDWPLPFVRGTTVADSIGNVEAVDIAARYRTEILYDFTAQSPYFYYTNDLGIAHVVWFEDARSIRAKLDLCNGLGILGAAYWNLMYSFPQNWLVLGSLFDIRKDA